VAADAEASSLEVVALPAEAVEAVEAAGEIAGYGPGFGPTTAGAGVNPHLRPRYLLSRQSNPHRQRNLSRKVTEISSPHEPNSVPRL
jgi:hypothetical protein